MKTLKIATRESPLALAQTQEIVFRLQFLYPDLTIQLLPMTTTGDKFLDNNLFEIGGKGLFVKELEQSLLDKRADIAIHSMKDVTMDLPEKLEIAVICKRTEPYDAFVSNHFPTLKSLPLRARIGTASVRRQSQLRAWRSDLNISNLRGNVNTRLQKLDEDEFDAIILAEAGLKRLQLSDRIKEIISPEICLPAVGQGALGIECRKDDVDTKNLIAALNDYPTFICVSAERAMNKRLNGGCHSPIAALAEIKNNVLKMEGLIAEIDGSSVNRAFVEGKLTEFETLGEQLAEKLTRFNYKA